MKEAYCIGERVLDEHALGIAGNEIFGGGFGIVGE